MKLMFSKDIRISQNKSLKNKLLSGSKLCGIHAEESKKIQAQLKELRYGKKDLLFKAQQLTELEQKLAVAKNELEKAALDRCTQNSEGKPSQGRGLVTNMQGSESICVLGHFFR
ncbi:hypothetical protein STEG23_035586, partial [Scotinomys teguina]